jgi:hypothetical protein
MSNTNLNDTPGTPEFRLNIQTIYDWAKVPFEFGHGWDLLVAEMLDQLEGDAGELGYDMEYIQLTAMEDSFGTLKVSGVWPAELDHIIETASRKSTETCRKCGEPGTLKVGAGVLWYVSCEAHTLPCSITTEEYAQEMRLALPSDNEPL